MLTSVLIILYLRGGYVEGSASEFNGNDLVREAGGGVVAAFIQYRLGVFGFLAGEKVKEGGALNAGLCECFSWLWKEVAFDILIYLVDQQAALRWVQKYVSVLN